MMKHIIIKNGMMNKTLLMIGMVCALHSPISSAVTGGMSLEENDRLRNAYPVPTGAMLGDNCSACHGTKGAEFNEAMPPLAGMKKAHFIKLMKTYRENAFTSIVMHDVAVVFSDVEIEAMANFFVQQKAEQWTQPNWNPSLKESQP
ncbi:MAG: hypothetical protein GXO35_06220 [Gammaproteobacteria bacterium]|nr:hypothetical protein [Gammaproteobacteria bacterium]